MTTSNGGEEAASDVTVPMGKHGPIYSEDQVRALMAEAVREAEAKIRKHYRGAAQAVSVARAASKKHYRGVIARQRGLLEKSYQRRVKALDDDLAVRRSKLEDEFQLRLETALNGHDDAVIATYLKNKPGIVGLPGNTAVRDEWRQVVLDWRGIAMRLLGVVENLSVKNQESENQ